MYVCLVVWDFRAADLGPVDRRSTFPPLVTLFLLQRFLVFNSVLSLLVSPSFVFILFSLFARFLFHKNCGQFISLDSNRTTARRVDSYNHGVVLSETPLPDNHLFQVSC